VGPLNQDIAVGEWGTIPSEATVNSSFNRSKDDWKRPYQSFKPDLEDPPVLTLFSLLLELPVTYGIHEIPIDCWLDSLTSIPNFERRMI